MINRNVTRRAGAVAPSAVVVLIAAAIRVPNYDIAWFGIDQVYFLSEAHRILAGSTDVVGPLSSGLNLVGPLYSYIVAGLLSIRDDAAFVAFVQVVCEIAATWFTFSAARALVGTPAAMAAAVAYAVSPILVLTTRVIWNPSLLPLFISMAWWAAVRYVQQPSTWRVLAVALIVGCTLPLHPTGLFAVVAVTITVLIARPPSFAKLALAGGVGILPLLPSLVRMAQQTGDVQTVQAAFAWPSNLPRELWSVVALFLAFPARVMPGDTVAVLAASAVVAQTLLSVAGIVWGLRQAPPARWIWLGLTFSFVVHVVFAGVYTRYISWHHLLALAPPAALLVAAAVSALPRARHTWAVVVVVVLAIAQLAFVFRFDNEARATGWMHFDFVTQGLMLRGTPSEAFSLTMREIRRVAHAVRPVIADDSAALTVVHGGRGELWRESIVQMRPIANTSSQHTDWEFTITGPKPRPVIRHAVVIDGKAVCATRRNTSTTWRAAHRALPGWESNGFADSEWVPFSMPRRAGPPLPADPKPAFAAWRSGRVVLRGRFSASGHDSRYLLAVTAHSPALAQVPLTEFFINGVAIAPAKSRVLYGVHRNEEWLFDLTAHVHRGENIVAIGFAAATNEFDLDAFVVPCVDDEWYF